MDREVAQTPKDRRSDEERHEQRRDEGTRRPEGDVVEKIEGP